MSKLSASSRADIVVAIVELDLAVSVYFQRFYSTPLFVYFRFALLLTWGGLDLAIFRVLGVLQNSYINK